MKITSKRILGFWHYGIILTYVSLTLSVCGICLSTARVPRPDMGVLLLLLAGLCDGFDGTIAKTRKHRTLDDISFGVQIDSLCDLVAFGIAPVMIGVGMGYTRWYYVIVYSFFVLCGLVRLAYFNVKEINKVMGVADTQSPAFKPGYTGMPITSIAISLPVFYLAATMLSPQVTSAAVADVLSPVIMMFCYFLSGILFIAKFQMPKFRVKGLIAMIVVMTVLVISMCLVRYYVCGVPLFQGPLK